MKPRSEPTFVLASDNPVDGSPISAWLLTSRWYQKSRPALSPFGRRAALR
jgi:hypothetical protein